MQEVKIYVFFQYNNTSKIYLVMKFKDALDNVKREIAIMKKLRHINCIKLFEVIENPDNDKLYMGFYLLKN